MRKAKRDSWKKFCETTESSSEMARIAKVIRYHLKLSLGFLKDRNGRMSSYPEETLEILARSSFPDCTEAHQDHKPKKASDQLFESKSEDWRSLQMKKKAFRDFSPMKAGGPDQFKPIALQHLPD